jgi:MFS family permease
VLWRRTGNHLAALLAAGMAAFVAAPFIDMRPHLYTLLCFAVLVALAWQRDASRWMLALLFLVWVNLHGGFFFGLMALGILLFPWRDLDLDRLRAALLTGLLCAAVATLNPSGLKTFLYPLIYAFDDSSPYRELAEWQSPFVAGGIRSPLFFVLMWFPLGAALYLLPAVRRRTGLPWEALALTLLTLAMALTSRRFIPIYGISLALLLAPLLALGLSVIRTRAIQLILASLLLLFAVARMQPYPLQAAPAFHYLTAEFSYPADSVDMLLHNGVSGRVFALYNWGGFLHWRSDGQLQVFIDGRADTVYDAPTYYQYKRVLMSQPGWIGLVERSGAEYFLWPFGKGAGEAKRDALLSTGRWMLIYEDSVSWLAARSDVVARTEWRPPEDSPLRRLSRAGFEMRHGEPALAMALLEDVRGELPWQQRACQWQIGLLRQQGAAAEASQVLADCRDWFPTAFLR